ncbi:MAG TPA: SUMF1/EgtB/PvdO family nonheme iron enzyme, partial [Methylomirabilota bacterium]|nr:SUMF1/EgtB/PvdO family nonheme iron enzyme [Methylomirabilota bacterium]
MCRALAALTMLALAVGVRLPAIADGIMLVQAGTFWMGRDDGPPEEAPLHRVFVRDVWIERHKVTNAEFAAFLNARGPRTAAGERRFDWDDDDARIHRCAVGAPSQGSGARRSGEECWAADAGLEHHPVVEVSWFGARDYCEW